MSRSFCQWRGRQAAAPHGASVAALVASRGSRRRRHPRAAPSRPSPAATRRAAAAAGGRRRTTAGRPSRVWAPHPGPMARRCVADNIHVSTSPALSHKQRSVDSKLGAESALATRCAEVGFGAFSHGARSKPHCLSHRPRCLQQRRFPDCVGWSRHRRAAAAPEQPPGGKPEGQQPARQQPGGRQPAVGPTIGAATAAAAAAATATAAAAATAGTPAAALRYICPKSCKS